MTTCKVCNEQHDYPTTVTANNSQAVLIQEIVALRKDNLEYEKLVTKLREENEQLHNKLYEAENLQEVRAAGCQCSDDEACKFVREREELKKENEQLRAENKRLVPEWQQCHDWNNELVKEHYDLRNQLAKAKSDCKKIALMIRVPEDCYDNGELARQYILSEDKDESTNTKTDWP